MGESVFNIILNTTLVYAFVLLGIRLLGKKELSQLALSDLIFIMLLGNAVQNAMIGEDQTLLGGLIAAATLFIWNKLIKNWMYKSAKFSKLMEGEPVILIRHGKIIENQLKKNKITIKDLEQACREQGEIDIHKIELAILEVDGKVSVIKQKD